MESEREPNRVQRPYALRERAFLFALELLRTTGKIPPVPEGRIIRNQLARAGASIGAYIEEADGAESRKDKRRSMVIARKEALETRYWLRLVQGLWGENIRVKNLIQEVTELKNILSAIIIKLGS